MADKDKIEFPHMLKKAGGGRCVVKDQDEYDRAVADGWLLHIDHESPEPPAEVTTTETTTTKVDPLSMPQQPLTPPPGAKDDTKPAAKDAHDAVLDGTVADVSEHVGKVTDIRKLQELKRQENKGAKRIGALDAIDARIEELKG